MKKLLLSFVVLSAVAVTAQVGINTDAPEATLDIRAKGKQEGDLRIEGVKEEKSTQWLLIWDEKDQKVKRTSLLEIKRKTLNEISIDYIREKQPAKADDIIHKIKQCAPENILFDKHFGDGKHDFVYCATTVTGKVNDKEYNKTWLNLNLGAAYADINSPHFNPTVNKTGTLAHKDDKTYGSYYQWQRASDGHEFRKPQFTDKKARTWTETGEVAGKFITSNDGHWVSNPSSDFNLWQAGEVNNPCPSGYHVPTIEEWEKFHQVVTEGSGYPSIFTNQMWIQDKLPNLAATGFRGYYDDDSLRGKNIFGFYWSSSVGKRLSAQYMVFSNDNSGMNDKERAFGHSVRCIKD